MPLPIWQWRINLPTFLSVSHFLLMLKRNQQWASLVLLYFGLTIVSHFGKLNSSLIQQQELTNFSWIKDLAQNTNKLTEWGRHLKMAGRHDGWNSSNQSGCTCFNVKAENKPLKQKSFHLLSIKDDFLLSNTIRYYKDKMLNLKTRCVLKIQTLTLL